MVECVAGEQSNLTRKRKLLETEEDARFGKIDIRQEGFVATLKMDG